MSGPAYTRAGGLRAWHAVLAVLVCLAGAGGTGAQNAGPALTLDEILFRANEAVVLQQRALSTALAEEHREQRILDPEGEVRRRRELRSDFALVRVPEDDVWLGFRDVFEVDGEAVRPRAPRLAELDFDDPGDLEAAARLNQQSERHRIGEVLRGLDVPTTSLAFLLPVNQFRFHFELADEDIVEGTPVHAVRFAEHRRPTLLRMGVTEVFARGTFWIEPGSGNVVRSELLVGDANTPVRARILTTYREREGVWMPIRMEETYEPRSPRADRVASDATYSAFRPLPVPDAR